MYKLETVGFLLLFVYLKAKSYSIVWAGLELTIFLW